MKDPKITFLICTHNGSKKIQKVLEAIANQNDISKELFEVLIVDNASDDNTAEIASEIIQSLHLNGRILFESRLGKTYAFMKGLFEARGQFMSIIDDDNYIDPDFTKNVIEIFDAHTDVGIIGSNNHIDVDSKYIPDWFKWASGRYACAKPWLDEIEESSNDLVIGKTGVVAGAGLSLRIEPLKACLNKGYKFFNDAQRSGGVNISGSEDVELCFLMRSLGYKFAYNSSIKLRHDIDIQRLNKETFFNSCKAYGGGSLGFDPFHFTDISTKDYWSYKLTWQWQLISKLKRYILLTFFPENVGKSNEEKQFRNKIAKMSCLGAIHRICVERSNYTRHISQIVSGEWTVLRVR